jgi:cobalt-zinc-cadmium efflux system membrane fusion protein
MISRFTIGALVLASVCAAGCRKDRAPAAAPETQTKNDEIILPVAEQTTARIETHAAQMSDTPDVLRVAGRIALADRRTWHVGVRTEGLVAVVNAGLGDFVKKGQVLARYHADELREARAQYRTAGSELERAQANAALAKRNADRMQNLLNIKAASVMQAEQARQDLESADAAVRRAQIDLDRTRDQLQEDLGVPADPKPGDRTADQIPIIAPASGYVIQKLVTPGKTVQPSTDAFVIGDLSEVWMLASVRQEDLGKLSIGQTARVTLRGLPDHVFSGKVSNLGQELDPTTRVMQVRIELSNIDNHLRPEMLVNAEIPVGAGTARLIVPADAVQQVNGQDVVFVRTAADRFKVRSVRVAPAIEAGVPVLEGLKPGEEIVTRGTFVLKSQLLRASMEGD